MNVAVIIAGGSGIRTNQDIPKQFLNVFDKPILIYTLERFEHHPEIDAIEVVCLEGWHEVLKAYAKQFKISKLKWVVSGGNTVQESIKNGIVNLKSKCKENDMIIIHDGIRPMVDDAIISDCLVKCKMYGNGISSLPFFEQIFSTSDNISTNKYILRDSVKRLQTPQAYKYGKLLWAYNKAYEEKIGIGPSDYTNTMLVDLGETLYFSAGSSKNINITTVDDIEIFKSLLLAKKDDWLR